MIKAKNNWRIGCIILGTLLIISIGVSANYINKNYCEEKDCNDIYLGVCFDKDSIFYKCNTEEDMCIKRDWDAANTIKFMEKNNIIIIGSSRCGWCKRQLEEFGNIADSLIDKGLYLDCVDPQNREICMRVEGTPSWMVNGEIVTSGYMPLDRIKESF
jgi:hypothetical protein